MTSDATVSYTMRRDTHQADTPSSNSRYQRWGQGDTQPLSGNVQQQANVRVYLTKMTGLLYIISTYDRSLIIGQCNTKKNRTKINASKSNSESLKLFYGSRVEIPVLHSSGQTHACTHKSQMTSDVLRYRGAYLLHVLPLLLHGSEDTFVGVAHAHDGLHTLPLTGGQAEQAPSAWERGRARAWDCVGLVGGKTRARAEITRMKS